MGNFCSIPSKSQRNAIITKSSLEGKNSESDTNVTSNLSSTSKTESINSQILEVPNLRIYTLNELRSATKNFKPNAVIGEGGFGKVYKGWLDSSTKTGQRIAVAIKKLNLESTQRSEERQAEVNFLGSVSHPNLVKPLGYCIKDSELLIVFEYMAKGSLKDHLFNKGTDSVPLSWNMRLKILIGAAQGLAFLHSSKQVIYRNFKPSNILLDSNYNPKLSDSGIAQIEQIEEDSEVSTLMGTFGYIAPEYVATGRLHVKSDVYGFGVVLLEMLSGLNVIDSNRQSEKQNLVEWAKPYLLDEQKLVKSVMDKSLEGQYTLEAALQAAQLTVHCLAAKPRERPSMDEVVHTLQNIYASTLIETL